MTDVVVQDLSKDTHGRVCSLLSYFSSSVRIQCQDLVRKVAVYNHRLAIQLSDQVNVYRQVSGGREHEQLAYRIIEHIQEHFECSLLVVTAQNLILCQVEAL